MKRKLDLRGLTGATFQAATAAVSLALLLLYTWIHTGALLARYVNPDAFGYLAAAGVELAIVSLSLRIGELRRNGRKAYGFYAVLVAVLAVSALANIAEGFYSKFDEELTFANIARIDALQAVIGIAATGLLSVIVLALSEIIGGDVRRAAQTAERAERRERSETQPPQAPEAQPTQPANIIALPLRHVCGKCGREFDKQTSLAAHLRHCQAKEATS